jgi:NADH-quinone oxidoreductase subunit H
VPPVTGPEPLALWQVLAIDATKVLVFFSIILTVFAMTTWLERRLLAFMQFRLGPNRTGPFGLLQPAADGIKLFFKEEHMPAGANPVLFYLAPAVSVITAFLAIAVIPYGPPITVWGHPVPLQIADLDVGVLYIFAVTALGVYGVVMAGWAANSKYTLIGGLRSSAQLFSYELALGLSWVGVIMVAGSFRLSDIVNAQAGGIQNWNMLAQLPAFVIYAIAATAETNRTPFDLPEGETELVAGFHTEYSSMKFALMQMAEYVNIFTVCALGTNLFMGGWHAPHPALQNLGPVPLGPLWFFGKFFFVLFFLIWLRGTVPRVRYDQLMHFGWKVLVPSAAVWIMVTAGIVASRGPR